MSRATTVRNLMVNIDICEELMKKISEAKRKLKNYSDSSSIDLKFDYNIADTCQLITLQVTQINYMLESYRTFVQAQYTKYKEELTNL